MKLMLISKYINKNNEIVGYKCQIDNKGNREIHNFNPNDMVSIIKDTPSSQRNCMVLRGTPCLKKKQLPSEQLTEI